MSENVIELASNSIEKTSGLEDIAIEVGENVDTLSSEFTSFIGMEFESEEDAYNFYNMHGEKKGFGIRRDYSVVDPMDGVKTSSKFCCSKEGKRKDGERAMKRYRAETRTGCKAFLKISYRRGIKKYIVTKWDDNHNHLLHIPETTHMMPSQRKVSATQGIDVEMAEKSGISLKSSYEFMSLHAGGRENLGFTRLDQKNYLRTKRQRALEDGEAGNLLEYFQTQASTNPSFKYAFQLDIFKSSSDLGTNAPKDATIRNTCHGDHMNAQIKGLKKKENGYKAWRRPKPWYEKSVKGGKKKTQIIEGCKISKSVSKEKSSLQESHSEVLETNIYNDLINQEHYTPQPPVTSSPSLSLIGKPVYAQHSSSDDSFFLGDDFYDFLGNNH